MSKFVREYPDERRVQILLQEGWIVDILTVDSGLTLQARPYPPLLPPLRPQVCAMTVSTKRLEPAPTLDLGPPTAA